MQSDQWQQIRGLFDAATDAEPALREPLLASAPPEVANAVRAMLAEIEGPSATLLAGRFRLLRPLGSGGMADVYAAHDEHLDTPVAVKILRTASLTPASLARFRREIALARQIGHENVCRLFDLHFHEATPFLSMELLEGPTLAQHLATQGALSPAQALPILRPIAAALEAAHRLQIVHRDLKPSNVILAPHRPVVTDFGLASETATDPTQPETATLIGTPLYMAPEQFRLAPPTPAMDIYALGALAFEMVAGRPAFPPDSPLRLALEKSHPPSALPVQLPAAWRRAIRRVIAPDPAERFPTASAFVDALEPRTLSRRTWLAAGTATAMAAGTVGWAFRPPPVRPPQAEALLTIATEAMLTSASWRAVRSLEQAVSLAPWDGELIARLAWAWLLLDQADRARALLPRSAPGPVRQCLEALFRLDETAALAALAGLPDERAILSAYLGAPADAIQREDAFNVHFYPYRAAALARNTREIPDFNAALTKLRQRNAEFAETLQIALIRTMLPAPDGPGMVPILSEILATARREANPELLCRGGAIHALLAFRAGDDASGLEWAQRVVDWGVEFHVPYVAAGAVADLAEGCLVASRFNDAAFYGELAITRADPCQAYRAVVSGRRTLSVIHEREGSVSRREASIALGNVAARQSGHPRLVR